MVATSAIVLLTMKAPELGIGALVGLFTLGLSLYRPKAFVMGALVLIVFSGTLQTLGGSLPLSSLDEALVLYCVVFTSLRRLFSGRTLASFPGLPFFALFVAFGLVSAAVHAVPPGVALPGLLLAVKGLLFGFAVAQLDWEPGDIRRIARVGAGIAVAIVVACAVNLVAPGPWMSVFAPGLSADKYLGLTSVVGPFARPAALGRMAAMLAVATFAYRVVVHSSRFNAFLLAALGGFAILSFRVKTLVALGVSLILIGVRRFGTNGIIVLIVVAPVAIVLLGGVIGNFVGADVQRYIFDSSARSTMTTASFDVASIYAPWGAGFGRFGSFIAATDYSPEYISRGFNAIWGLSRDGNGAFLTDTAWPAVIGEAGWLGAGAFAVGLIVVLRLFSRRDPLDDTMTVWLRLTGMGWFTVMMIESIAAPVFTSAPSYPLMFAVAGLVVALNRTRLEGSGFSPGPIRQGTPQTRIGTE